jgi:octaprenyl-diphosphate synthase
MDSPNLIRDPKGNTAAERFNSAIKLVPELTQVEEVIRESFQSDVLPMREIPDYLLSLGGKRIRPALTLLCAKALGINHISDKLINVAAGIELIHMATLMHDDIIDQSPIRRHKQSPYAKFGTPLTLLSGDFLLTRAFGLCARLDEVAIAATEAACIELVEGEALETPLHTANHSLETSLTIAKRKTASLFRLATFCAAHLNEASEATAKSFADFGENLGIAFQIIDDILDVTSTEEVLGKQPGLDIIERKPSVVNVLWLASGEAEAERLCEAPIPGQEHDFASTSLAYLTSSKYVAAAKELANSYGAKARSSLLSGLENHPNCAPEAAQALHTVIDFALERLK